MKWNIFKKKKSEKEIWLEKVNDMINSCNRTIELYSNAMNNMNDAYKIVDTLEDGLPLRYYNAKYVFPVDKEWIKETINRSYKYCSESIKQNEGYIKELKEAIKENE